MDNDTKPNRVITEFRTSELPLVAFLRYSGQQVKEVVRVNEKRAEFVFHNVEKQLLDQYNTDFASVEPKMFSAIMRQQHRAALRITKS